MHMESMGLEGSFVFQYHPFRFALDIGTRHMRCFSFPKMRFDMRPHCSRASKLLSAEDTWRWAYSAAGSRSRLLECNDARLDRRPGELVTEHGSVP